MILAAFADPTRRQLLDALVDAGRASATTIAGRLPVSRQATAKHMQILEAAGLVEGVREAAEAAVTRSEAGPMTSLESAGHNPDDPQCEGLRR